MSRRRQLPLPGGSLLKIAGRDAERDADDWYERGSELEATAVVEAKEAYRRALALDPAHFDTHLDLGRLLHEEGDLRAAEKHYRAALERRPGDATAAYNLGVALQDRGRLRQAVEAYRKAVAADPDCADAYFNLAGLYDELGKQAVAIQNLKRYKHLKEGRKGSEVVESSF